MTDNEIVKILKDRRFQWAVVIVALLVILFWSSSIRLSNWDLLTDQTTGEKIPLALDPFYFLRMSETIVETGSLPGVDNMRYPAMEVGFSKEIMPQAMVFMYNVGNFFGDYTLREINVFSPVAFYFIGLVFFFALTYFLTRSKWAALISSAFLGFAPAYLYRTMAGFSDHESIGMMAFFAALISFVFVLKKLVESKKLKGLFSLSVLAGFFTALTIASWGGVAKFAFMIFPLAFLILWLVNTRSDKSFIKRGLGAYVLWLVSTLILGNLLGFGSGLIFRRFLLNTNGLISLFVLAFIILDAILIYNIRKINFIKKKYRAAYSFGGAILVGIIGLSLLGRNVFAILQDAWISIFHPWGVGRVGLTVAENAQPYLLDWINQSGNILFWMFFAGIILLGFEISKRISSKKRKVLFGLFWIILICGTLFSRISAGSLMNGTNFLSQLVYIGSFILSLGFFAWLYFKEKIKIGPELAFIIAWMFFTLVSGRAAQRLFFAITPFVCFAAAYAILRVWRYFKDNKDELIRPVMIVLLIVGTLGGAHTIYTFENTVSAQAAGTGPSAHYQWQNAMAWVRDNTNPDATFTHWWDYGYWVQTLGERKTLTDGGHQNTQWDHLIGRYLLTTPNPDSAYSFMKTHKVDYLLIDPTDLGKYPAYSRIGSDDDGEDRYSAIPVMGLDVRQTVETSNGTVFVYSGGVFVDEDINYNLNGRNIFLPAQKASIAGVIWQIAASGATGNAQAPIGVFFYNGQRYDIPLRYVYANGQISDFGQGIESVVRVIPSFDGNQMNNLGAVAYLSPKVSRGLFAQLYLLNDAFGNYPDIKIAHKEDDIVVQSLKSQGVALNDFVYYRGFRGPIKIWEVNYPEGIIEYAEFLETREDLAKMDDWEFREG